MHGNQDTQAFDASHLDIDFDLPCTVDEMAFPDLYVGLDINLLAPGDGIVTDRHHASADRYEADDPQNQIAGQISPFTLSGWLRHGCERMVQEAGATACHPGESNADYMLQDVYDRDLDAGITRKAAVLMPTTMTTRAASSMTCSVGSTIVRGVSSAARFGSHPSADRWMSRRVRPKLTTAN